MDFDNSHTVGCFFEGYKFHRFCGFLGLPWNLFHQRLVEILSWHILQTEEKTTVILICRYQEQRFPNTYWHIATTQSLAIVSIASHITRPIYVSAASEVFISV